MKSPKVSICIPAYSNPNSVIRAMNSILEQKYSDFEIVITDDTPDNSVHDAVKQFAGDLRIRYYKNAEKKGSPENWNYAVNLADGDYIKILHHDDWFIDDDCLAEFVAILDNHPEINLAFCPSKNIGLKNEVLSISRATQDEILSILKRPDNLFLNNIIGSPSATIFRGKTKERFDPRLKYFVDAEFYLRLLKKEKKLMMMERPLVNIQNESPDQMTAYCVNNSDLLIYENIYFYTKLSRGRYFDPRFLRTIARILNYYQIYSRNRLNDFGIDFPIPFEVILVIYLLKPRNFIKKLFKRTQET